MFLNHESDAPKGVVTKHNRAGESVMRRKEVTAGVPRTYDELENVSKVTIAHGTNISPIVSRSDVDPVYDFETISFPQPRLSNVISPLAHPCAWNRPFRLHPVVRRTFQRDLLNIAFGAACAVIVWWLVA